MLLFVISCVTFIIFYVLPVRRPGGAARGPRRRPASSSRQIRHNLGLDKPWYVAVLATTCKRLVLHFDFGYSYQNNVVGQAQIFDRLPATISLVVGAAVVWLLIGVPIGIISAVRRGTCSTASRWAARWSRSRRRSTGSASSSLYLFSDDIGKFPIFPGAGSYVAVLAGPGASGSGR